MSNRPRPTQGDRLVIDSVVLHADRKPTGYVPKPATLLVGPLIFQALTSLPSWACFPMVVVAMMLTSWLAEWEDNQPGGFNDPNSDR